MNDGKPTLKEKWNGLREWLQRPKTKFDLKDRLRALALLLILTAVLCKILRRLGG